MPQNLNVYLVKLKNNYRSKYGNLVDKIFNPQLLPQLDNLEYNPLEVFELLFKVYEDLSNHYRCLFEIRLSQNEQVILDLDRSITTITIEKDNFDGNIYIRLSDFYLPKGKIKKVNNTDKNLSYTHNGYRIIKTLEVICKIWRFAGVKITHITNLKLAQTLRGDGYDNIYKLRGNVSFPEQDYVKFIPTNEEVSDKYCFEYELENNKFKGKKYIKNRLLTIFQIICKGSF